MVAIVINKKNFYYRKPKSNFKRLRLKKALGFDGKVVRKLSVWFLKEEEEIKLRKYLTPNWQINCIPAFLDVRQVFDKVWHEDLPHKIKRALPDQWLPIDTTILDNKTNKPTFVCKRWSVSR